MPKAIPPKGKYNLPILIGLTVYLILAFIEPYGLNKYTGADKPIRLIGYGLIIGILIFVFHVSLAKRFSRLYDLGYWSRNGD